MKKLEAKFIQLVSAQWGGTGGQTYSLYALSSDGEVYRLVPGMGAWKKIGKRVASVGELDDYYSDKGPES